jgi:DNA-binding MarR family transcriptional regulator
MGTHTSAPPGGQTRDVLDAIRRIVQALRVSARRAERDVGLTAAQLFVLHRLADGGGPLSVNELAARTFTHQSTVSVVVQRLVDRGLVARERSSTDGRRAELTLTPAGRTLLRKAPAAAQERLIAALDAMPAARRAALAGTLEALVSAMGLDAQPPGLFFEEAKPARSPATRTKRRPRGRPSPSTRAR